MKIYFCVYVQSLSVILPLLSEFLSTCAEVYKEIQQNPQSGHETVVVPTSQESPSPPIVHQKEAGSERGDGARGEGVDAMQYFRALIPAAEKVEFRYWPLFCLHYYLWSVFKG